MAPASYQQREVWLNQQIATASPAYNVVFRYEVAGTVDADRLRAALAALVGRHAALRASFHFDGQEVCQRIAATCPIDIAELDDPDAELRFAGETFALTEPPLFRCARRVADGLTHLTLVYHHLLVDGWSAAVLEADLAAAYADPHALRAGEDRSYLDYCAAQRDMAADAPLLAAERSYWSRLLGDRAPIRLPGMTAVGGPGPAAERTIALDRAAVRSARARAAAQRVTPFTVVLEAFCRTAARLTGTSSAVVGVTVAGRSEPAYLDTVGLFAHVVPFTFSEGDGLAAIKEQVWNSQARPVLPWELVFAGDARRARLATRWPLSITALQDTPAPPLGAPSCRRPPPRLDSKAPFLLRVDLSDDDIVPTVVYQRDVFGAALLDEIVACFVRAFEATVTA